MNDFVSSDGSFCVPRRMINAAISSIFSWFPGLHAAIPITMPIKGLHRKLVVVFYFKRRVLPSNPIRSIEIDFIIGFFHPMSDLHLSLFLLLVIDIGRIVPFSSTFAIRRNNV